MKHLLQFLVFFLLIPVNLYAQNSTRGYEAENYDLTPKLLENQEMTNALMHLLLTFQNKAKALVLSKQDGKKKFSPCEVDNMSLKVFYSQKNGLPCIYSRYKQPIIYNLDGNRLTVQNGRLDLLTNNKKYSLIVETSKFVLIVKSKEGDRTMFVQSLEKIVMAEKTSDAKTIKYTTGWFDYPDVAMLQILNSFAKAMSSFPRL